MKYNELIGEKDLDMPVRIGPTNGAQMLREEVSNLYPGVVKANGVLVTHGAAEANFLLLNHLVSRDDECVLVVPNYMQAYGILRAIGAQVKLSGLDRERGWSLNIEEMKEMVSRKTKAILVTNPNNPTGARLEEAELRAICDIAQAADAYVVGDEVLSGLELDGRRTTSPVEVYEKGISTRSVSKLGLSGLRVGWIAARDPTIAAKCWAIRDYTSLGSSYFNQHIAAVALQNLEKIRQRDREILNDRAAILREGVAENSQTLQCTPPQAGATALVTYKLNVGSVDFCRRLADKEHLAVSPGDYFEAPKSFRILYGTHAEKLRAALERIGRFVRGLQ